MEGSHETVSEPVGPGVEPPAGELESGWALVGEDGRQRSIRLLVGEGRLNRAYLGLTIGRHPALSELAIDDPTVSRRHARIGRNSDGLFIEDVNSLNGTWVDGRALQPFVPVALHEGQTIVLGETVLTIERLASGPGGSAGG